MTLRDSEERFSPHQTGDIALDHMARYAMALMMVKPDDEVLDVASGEGYGSALLSNRCRRVTGVDLSAEAVEHAASRYVAPNLRYLHGDAEDLPLPDQFFDVIVSFETIEHLRTPGAALAHMKRVLKPRGYVVISTPDADVYNAGRAAKNPYHPSEFTAYDFEALLAYHFRYVRMLGQSTSRYSLISSQDGSPTSSFSVASSKGQDMTLGPVIRKPMYLIGVASNHALPALPSLVYG